MSAGARAHVTIPPDIRTTGVVIEGTNTTYQFTLKDQGTCPAIITAQVIDPDIATITPTGPIAAVEVQFTVIPKKVGQTSIKLAWVGSDYPDPPCNESVPDYSIPFAVIAPGAARPVFTPVGPQQAVVGVSKQIQVTATHGSAALPATLTATGLPDGAVFDSVLGLLSFHPNTNQVGFQRAQIEAADNSNPTNTSTQTIDFVVLPADRFTLDIDRFASKVKLGVHSKLNLPLTISSSSNLADWWPYAVLDGRPRDSLSISQDDLSNAEFFRAFTGFSVREYSGDSFEFRQPLPTGYAAETDMHYAIVENPNENPVFTNKVHAEDGPFTVGIPTTSLPDQWSIHWYFQDDQQNSGVLSQQMQRVTTPWNTAPRIGYVRDLTLPLGGTATIDFSASDAETPQGLLQLDARSANQDVIPDTNIVFRIHDESTLTASTNTPGTATIEIRVSDDLLTSTQVFNVTVTAVGDVPTISGLTNLTILMGTTSAAIPFTVEDGTNPPNQLTVTARTLNRDLIPDSGIVVEGIGTNRTIRITPVEGETGVGRIGVTVTDGTFSASTRVRVNVTSGVAGDDADFNQDGRADLIYQDNAGLLAAWFMDGSSVSSTNLFNPSNSGNPNWRVVGSGDFNQNTTSDLLFQHTDGTLAVWYMNGMDLVSGSLLTPSRYPGDPDWRVVATGNFNTDTNPDLLFQHADGTLAAWYMDGIDLISGTALNPPTAGIGWRVGATGDFNQDGQTDLAFQHDDSRLEAWFMNGTNLVLQVPFNPERPEDDQWRLAGAADLDEDHTSDLLFQHTDGSLAVWYMNGTNLTRIESITPPITGGTWRIVAP